MIHQLTTHSNLITFYLLFQDSLTMSLSLLPPNALVGLITFGKMVRENAKW